MKSVALLTLMLLTASCGVKQNVKPGAGGSQTPSGSVSATPLKVRPTADCPKQTGGVATYANLINVEVNETDKADTVTFTFRPAKDVPVGVPTYEIAGSSSPFTRDPSDEPMDVAGNSFLTLIFHGGSGVDTTSNPYVETYKGPKEFKVNKEVLTELEEQGDFEATLSWVFGLDFNDCPNMKVLENPPRLVVEFDL